MPSSALVKYSLVPALLCSLSRQPPRASRSTFSATFSGLKRSALLPH